MKKRTVPGSGPGSPVQGMPAKKSRTEISSFDSVDPIDAHAITHAPAPVKPVADIATQAPGADDGWMKVESRKNKKARKLEVKKDTNAPRFMYATAEIQRRKEAVGIADVRDLVLHLTADAPPPSWVRVDNLRSIDKTIVLLLPGLLPTHLSLPPRPTSATTNPNLPIPIPNSSSSFDTLVPWLSKTFSHALPTRAPGDQWRMHSIMSEFFTSPVTGEEKRKRQEARHASERSGPRDASRYTLSIEEMIEHEYPLPSYMASVFSKPDDGEGWIEVPLNTNKPKPVPTECDDGELRMKVPQARVLALDCEMCQTEAGNELARLCLIDYRSKKVIYDTHVKPSRPITDYLTRWSGIQPGSLDNVTTTLSDVQQHLLPLLSSRSDSDPTPILLGHSLESDLKALKICHPRVIDTAIRYGHPRGRPFKPGLAWLARKWLNREIQNRGEGGHDPEEDARACVDLLAKKISNGPGFGEFKMDMESIFDRMTRSTRQTRSFVVDHGNPSGMHGAKASSCSGVKSDEEALEQMLGGVASHSMVFGRFSGVAEVSNWISQKSTPDDPEPAPRAEATDAELNAALRVLDDRLSKLHAALPPRTALVLFTGHSDPRAMAALGQRKAAFEQAVRHGMQPEELREDMRWTSQDARQLEEEVECAKRGLLFLCVK